MTERHFATEHLVRLINMPLDIDGVHNPEVHALITTTARRLVNLLDDGPELTIGLRHLLDAKQSFATQATLDARAKLQGRFQ